MPKPNLKSVVITGCDIPNSYGYELALCLDNQGYSVFAGCTDCNSIGARSLASRGSTNLAVLQCDVTKQDEIDDAVEMIEDMVGDDGLWAVVNAAEAYAVAEVDWFSAEDFERIMQVNFLGLVRVTKSVLHLLRKARGRVVNLSSMAGCVSRAGMSAFSSSKFAIEAFSDSLRQEMLKWGVFVSLVQPAYFPVGEIVLSDEETSIRLKRVPPQVKDVYGEGYFVDYIHSVSGTTNRKLQTEEAKSKLLPDSKASSGYNSLSSSLKSGDTLPKKSGKNKPSTSKDNLVIPPADETRKRRSLSTLNSSASLSLKGTPNLGNTNRVLHALVEAVSADSPKVRYFVGSFQDRVVKSLTNVLPTVVMDTYFTSGQMVKVVPKLIKEKLE